MPTTTIREVQHNLAAVIRRVEAGEEVAIYRREKAVARIVPVEPDSNRHVDWSELSVWKKTAFRRRRFPGKMISDLVAEGRGNR